MNHGEMTYGAEASRLKQGLEEWAAEGRLPEDRSAALAALARQTLAGQRRGPVQRILRWAAVAAVAAVAAAAVTWAAWPGARAWAASTFPGVARYMERWSAVEQGWAWAEEHGMFQEVLAADTDRGYTFRVHQVLADPTQTTVVYTVEGPDPGRPDFWAGERDALRFNGREFAHSLGGRDEVIDGVRVGSIEVDPLPAESGTLAIVLRRIGEIEGRWQVRFPVTRAPLTALARTVPVGRVLEVAGIPLQVTEVQLTPTRTVVRLRYEGAGPGPDLSVRDNPELIGPSGPLGHANSGGSGGQCTAGGDCFLDYEFGYQPLPEGTAAVTLRIPTARVVDRGAVLRVPLTSGATAAVAGLHEVTVAAVERDRTVLHIPRIDRVWNPYEDWWVIDDRGEAHRASRSGSSEGEVMVLSVIPDEWPRGRQAVALEAREVWREVRGPWEMPIPLE